MTWTSTAHSFSLVSDSNSIELIKNAGGRDEGAKVAKLRRRYAPLEKVYSKLRLWQEGWMSRVRRNRAVAG